MSDRPTTLSTAGLFWTVFWAVLLAHITFAVLAYAGARLYLQHKIAEARAPVDTGPDTLFGVPLK